MRPRIVQQRKIIGAIAICAGVLIGFFGFIALAQSPQGEGWTASALIGTGVFAVEGMEVGKVSAVTIGRDGHISEIRVTTVPRLGQVERTVAVRRGNFITLTGAVVLDLTAEEVDTLPVQTVRRGIAA